MNDKNKKLKLFNDTGDESHFEFTGGKDSYGLVSLEQAENTFTKNRCANCLEIFNQSDFQRNNYDLWTNRKNSFLNVNEFSPHSTKLEAVFSITQITHKVCELKKFKDDKFTNYFEERPFDAQTFLKDKEYWIEERPTEYLIFVKYKNKTYNSNVSKRRAIMFHNNQNVKMSIVNLALSDIRLQITKNENLEKIIGRKEYKNHHEN